MLYSVSPFCTTYTSGRQSFSRWPFLRATSAVAALFFSASARSKTGARCPFEAQPSNKAVISNHVQNWINRMGASCFTYQQRHKLHCFQFGFAKSARIAFDQIQPLFLHPDRQHHSTTDRELLPPRHCQRGCGCSHDDAVKRRSLRQSGTASRITHADVAYLQVAHLLPGTF